MFRIPRRAGVAIVALALFVSLACIASADSNAPLVTVSFGKGPTTIVQLEVGTPYFSNHPQAISQLTPELQGLEFTSRPNLVSTNVTVEASAGATVYLLVHSEDGALKNKQGYADARQALVNDGWTRVPTDTRYGPPKKNWSIAVYRRTFDTASKVSYTFTGRGDGYAAASANLAVIGAPSEKDNPQPADNPAPTVDRGPVNPDHIRVRARPGMKPIDGTTVHIANQQATIKILVVYEENGTDIGGQATDFILTVTPGDDSHVVTAAFVTPIGDEMAGVVDDVLRFIHIKYPNWYADNAEFTFGDRQPYDGPSIGAAVGTLIRSVIEGFQIDPNAAITGDVAANGRVHGIGGLTYKIHGAVDAGCSIVAAPMENYDNLVDAVIYKGDSIVTGVQVIGMENLDDAVAIVRTHRDPRLSAAIALFSKVQDQLKQSPRALYDQETQSELQQILNLAPNHLSAKVLLAAAQHKLPRTLSPTASLYYTGVAVNVMLPILKDRSYFDGEHHISSVTVQEQLTNLDKLTPIADPSIRPLIDAWAHYLRAWTALQSGFGSSDAVGMQYDRLMDEIDKVNADPDLNQKLLNEGM